ncbi:MAG: L-threonate dehydrogenase [Chloroflexota bacterium]
MAENSKLNIGFVGLGSMGMGMAQSLVRAGIPTKAYDIRPEAVATFVEAGGTGVGSVAEAAGGVDVLIIVVVNADQAEDVLFGAGNAAATLTQGSVVMLCSTVQPDYARSTAARLEAMGLGMLDAPISGGPIKAAAGEMTIMASGKPALFERLEPALSAMAANVYPMGDDCGLGSTMKIINQLLAGVNLAVSSEAMAFGARAGMDPEKIYEVICASAGNSWMFENRVPHILADDYTPESAVDIWVKDLGIVLDTARGIRFPAYLAAVAHQMFMMTSAAGHGRLDDTAVVKMYEALMDFKVVNKETT